MRDSERDGEKRCYLVDSGGGGMWLLVVVGGGGWWFWFPGNIEGKQKEKWEGRGGLGCGDFWFIFLLI